ncbi:MAG: PTS sugar transporter subunit IIA [Spirochaetia bacterium]|jgi:fructose-specific phosphotransferase system IIA component|nr:PTS sugar transporter subunit IIA [Spirochaetia bacterium]
MSPVIEYTSSKFIKKLKSTDKFSAIEELARVFEGSDICSDVPSLITALKEREEILSTGIGMGIAIPHAKVNAVNEMAFAIGISRKGINFDSLDGNPAKLIILVAAGERQHKDYLRLLSNIMAILKNEKIKNTLIEADSSETIMTILKSKEN